MMVRVQKVRKSNLKCDSGANFCCKYVTKKELAKYVAIRPPISR